MKTKKPLKKYQKKGQVVDTKAPGDDLSISNAVRRIAVNPKNVDNVMKQALRLHPFTQIVRGAGEVATAIMRAAGNKKEQTHKTERDSTYNAQKKALQQQLKDKYGFSFKKGGSTKIKAKSKNK